MSATPQSNPTMEFTGERMVPEGADTEIFWEHVYRYRFAAGYARGKRVLDAACGEGYGSSALKSAGSVSVIGIDISAEAVEHAIKKYGIDARQGDAANLPVDDSSIDLIVSYETIEHVPDPDRFLDECRRVLAPQGRIIISTPNKEVYGDNYSNPFHCSEMTRDEFHGKLSKRFNAVKIYTQRPQYAPWWSTRWAIADRSSAFKLRGLGRARNILRKLLIPSITSVPSILAPESLSKIILGSDLPGAVYVNQFAIFPEANFKDERPRYFIAVATV